MFVLATLQQNELLHRYLSRILLKFQDQVFLRTPLKGCFKSFFTSRLKNVIAATSKKKKKVNGISSTSVCKRILHLKLC